jgi:HJR/Mrr/RecB family endonuclease
MTKWADFEEEVRLLLECFGYSARTTPKSGDHGVDVIGEKGDRRVAAQVKLYGNGRVGN